MINKELLINFRGKDYYTYIDYHEYSDGKSITLDMGDGAFKDKEGDEYCLHLEFTFDNEEDDLFTGNGFIAEAVFEDDTILLYPSDLMISPSVDTINEYLTKEEYEALKKEIKTFAEENGIDIDEEYENDYDEESI